LRRIVVTDAVDFEPRRNTVLSISCHRLEIDELRELLDRARHSGARIVAEIGSDEIAQLATVFLGIYNVRRVSKHVVRGDETVVILKKTHAVVLNVATLIGSVVKR